MDYVRKLAVSLFFVSLAVFAGADELDDIIEKHIQAHGGREAWQNIRSISLRGQFTSFSEKKSFYCVKMSSGAYYHEFHIGQHDVVEGFDGETGWTIDPWQGFTFPRNANRNELNVYEQQACFFSPFLDYKEKGHEAAYLGMEEMDGMDVHVLKLTRKSGLEETWYLDAETFFAYKSQSQWIDFASPAPSEAYYDEYTEVDGLVLPFLVERVFFNRLWQTEVEEVQINPDIDWNYFTIPDCPAMQRLSLMQGEWKADIEVRNRQDQMVFTESTDCDMAYSCRDLLEGSFVSGTFFPAMTRMSIHYNRRNHLYYLIVFNDFNSMTEVFEGDFADGALLLENKNSVMGAEKVPVRYSIMFPDQEQFVIERARSSDNGLSWPVVERITFNRKDI
jgi:hypothetical protein